MDAGERWGEGWESGVTEEGRRDRSESEGIYVDGSGMQVKRSEGAGGEAWNVITMKRYGGESVSLSGDETMRVRLTNVHTYILQKLLCTDTSSSIKGDLHLANLLINLLHKLKMTREKKTGQTQQVSECTAHPGTACTPVHAQTALAEQNTYVCEYTVGCQ